MSPYEVLLLSDPLRRIGLCARLRPGTEPEVPPAAELRSAPGLHDLRLFQLAQPGSTLLFACCTLDRTSDTGGIPSSLASEPWWGRLNHLTVDGWQRMEFINLVAHPQVFPHRPGAMVQSIGLVAGLRRDSEAVYRSLHQTNWPGVVDRMVRSNYRAWTTFLIEIDGTLLLFTSVEYGGIDRAADDAATAADPVTQRWWKHTEPCLLPLVAGGGNWAVMRRLPTP